MLVEQDALQKLVVAGDLLEPDQATVTENDDLHVVMQMFSNSIADEIPVVDAVDQKTLVGSVHKRDVIHAYNQEVLRRDLAGTIQSTVVVASKGQQVDIGGGYVMQEVLPPPRYFGHTIRELAIAAETGAQVVLLRKRDPVDGRPAVRVATADDVIDEGDRLVVAGTRAAVESLDAI